MLQKAYTAFILSFSDIKKETLNNFLLITKIKKIFPKLIEKSTVLENETDITMPKDTFGELLINIRNSRNGEEIEDIWKATYNWYIENDEWKEKILKAIKGYENKSKTEKISRTNIQRLYGNILKTSVSRLEQYRKCPFSFHLTYGLKLREKDELKINALDTGSFMHEVIDMFFKEIDENNLNLKEIDEDTIKRIINKIMNVLLQTSRYYIFTSSAKFRLLTRRLKKVVYKSICYIVYSLKYSDFKLLGHEIEFSNTGKYKTINMPKNFIKPLDFYFFLL